MSSIDYDLVSSLQRSPANDNEATLRAEEIRLLGQAREWGLGYGSGGWASDLQLLADLQHYGTSTRLIDMTSNPMTALWFACQEPEQPAHGGRISESGVLLAINIDGWTRYGRAHPAANRMAVDDPLGWELESGIQRGEPFVVESLTPNDRLRAQEGFFIASRVPEREQDLSPFKSLSIVYKHGEPESLRDRLFDVHQARSWQGPVPFVAVKIRSFLKDKIRLRLENSYNRHPRVLFPDFSGFRDFGASATPRQPLSERRGYPDAY